ncbi:tetratricopeptide repeat protein [Flavobacterium tegetincola]|uniref:tetratricopeptide repeat protein n=1 Tax=Flavobacterium tegetincola TaxID=150172 RepID=UPI00040E3942|nr:tetratricopeptide repeat protein [Flavobacterium tegetincola]
MKRKYSIVAAALLISMGAVAQKDEFKTLKKIYEKDKPSAKDVMQYKAAVVSATPLVAASNEEDTVYLNFYKAGIPFVEMNEAMAKPENSINPANAFKYFTADKIADLTDKANAVLAYEKKSGKSVFTKDIQEMQLNFKPTLLSYAISLGNEKRFSDASSVLYSMYKMDPTDVEKLYYAANYAVNASDFKSALIYYQTLKDLNYSGEKMNYTATSKLNDTDEFFGSKSDRDKAIKVGTHTNPKDEQEPSKRGEIYKNIALIYVSEGKTDEAKTAIIEARKANPDDVSLILAEADLYLKTNEMDTYAKLIKQVLEKDPNNADLVYNLGVVSGQNKDSKNAEVYYMRAIELKPDFANAYYNLSAVKLDAAQLILDQMNKLGVTAADNKKFDVLKEQRNGILKESMSLLEKTVSLDKKNLDAKEVLLSVYKALEMKEKAKALSAQLDK